MELRYWGASRNEIDRKFNLPIGQKLVQIFKEISDDGNVFELHVLLRWLISLDYKENTRGGVVTLKKEIWLTRDLKDYSLPKTVPNCMIGSQPVHAKNHIEILQVQKYQVY